jgi:TRAP-type uncharacterized transport system substrate-binding protein
MATSPARIMRALFPMYDTAFHFVVPDESGIRSMADLSGKRVGVGPRQGTGGTYMRQLFQALNIGPVLAYGDWTNLTSQFEQHHLDDLAVAAGVPSRPSSNSNGRPVCVTCRRPRARSAICASPSRNSAFRPFQPEPTHP